jgi:hypothetical protein
VTNRIIELPVRPEGRGAQERGQSDAGSKD